MKETVSWTCMICGEDRPDEFISVDSWKFIKPGTRHAEFTGNIRYCNDRPECKKGTTDHPLLNQLRQLGYSEVSDTWIDINEQKPDNNQQCRVLFDDGTESTGQYFGDLGIFALNGELTSLQPQFVTHWRVTC